MLKVCWVSCKFCQSTQLGQSAVSSPAACGTEFHPNSLSGAPGGWKVSGNKLISWLTCAHFSTPVWEAEFQAALETQPALCLPELTWGTGEGAGEGQGRRNQDWPWKMPGMAGLWDLGRLSLGAWNPGMLRESEGAGMECGWKSSKRATVLASSVILVPSSPSCPGGLVPFPNPVPKWLFARVSQCVVVFMT